MSLSNRAKALYEFRLRRKMEVDHFGKFVAIEPDSEESFVGDSFITAALAARQAHPDKESFVIRVGHDAAFHIGASQL